MNNMYRIIGGIQTGENFTSVVALCWTIINIQPVFSHCFAFFAYKMILFLFSSEATKKKIYLCSGITIEEGFKQKPRQRSSRLFGGQLLCRASYFALVVLKEMVEIILFFQNDRGKMACAARNLPPTTEATTFALASVPSLLLWLRSFVYLILFWLG